MEHNDQLETVNDMLLDTEFDAFDEDPSVLYNELEVSFIEELA